MPHDQRILDSHIHLWPATATSSEHHAWMSPGHFLARRHGVEGYLGVTDVKPGGFVYVETDRYLPSPSPDVQPGDGEEEIKKNIEEWAKQPLEEIRFLRRIIEGKAVEGDGVKGDGVEGDGVEDDGVDEESGILMKGVVLYAPFHIEPVHFSIYLRIAEQVAGPRLWKRVVGFRYLLQGKGDGVVESMFEDTKGGWFTENLYQLRKGNGGKGWCFDVGVDTHRDGLGPFEAVMRLVQRMRRGEDDPSGRRPVRFVLNHLGKPNLSKQPDERWLKGMEALGADKNVYMKLSGAFNEFDDTTPSDIPTLLSSLTPFLEHVFKCFPNRVMFGSDWPVCNVGGPNGEKRNWNLWRQVVQAWMDQQGFGDEERESVWWKAGCEAYGVEI